MKTRVRYLVYGSTGEWEDDYEWTVGVFDTKTVANKWAKAANALAKKLNVHWDSGSIDWPTRESAELVFKAFDSACRIDNTGVRYLVYSVPVCPPFPPKDV